MLKHSNVLVMGGASRHIVPYSGKFSREKTFADWYERSISRRKLSWNVKTGCIMGVACLEFCGENFRGWLKNREIRESFLP